jgi:hypothetical protein
VVKISVQLFNNTLYNTEGGDEMILLSRNILLLRIVKLQLHQLGLDIPKSHKMKSQGFRSGDLTGYTTRPFRLIQHAGKFSVGL